MYRLNHVLRYRYNNKNNILIDNDAYKKTMLYEFVQNFKKIDILILLLIKKKDLGKRLF